ncbi:MAG: 50S ribosomal protein L6 [Candidatus Cloacimonadota bacterium]|nr:MAG: 50S ribosomal protein L6 [Candidatus Cloacimonadota bacterium]
MSRIGNAPILVPKNVKVKISDNIVTVIGPNGELTHTLSEGITVELKDNQINVFRINDERKYKSLHGLNRSLLNNMIQGVLQGYVKKLYVVGKGYKANVIQNWLVLQLGYSHDIMLEIPSGIKIETEKISRAQASSIQDLQAIIDVSGIDKELVGQIAAEIRATKPPEPYKGKGIRYSDEHVRRKAGKTASGTGAK